MESLYCGRSIEEEQERNRKNFSGTYISRCGNGRSDNEKNPIVVVGEALSLLSFVVAIVSPIIELLLWLAYCV